MGGSYYDRDVQSSSNVQPQQQQVQDQQSQQQQQQQSSNQAQFDYSQQAQQVFNNKTIHKSVDPQRFQQNEDTQQLVCQHSNPIVIALDVTGSMGDWAKIIYDKLPMFYGQIMQQGYLKDPAISFCAIGDSTTDAAPLQITEFGQGKQIDELVSKIWLEGQGGGNKHESYELAAFFYQYQTDLENCELPFFFVTGDEMFWETIPKGTIKQRTGFEVPENMDSKQVFQDLLTSYNVFHLHKAYWHKPDEIKVKKQWVEAIGEYRVIDIQTPKACVDVMLGIIAIVSGTRTLKDYVQDLINRGQTRERIKEVTNALKNIGQIKSVRRDQNNDDQQQQQQQQQLSDDQVQQQSSQNSKVQQQQFQQIDNQIQKLNIEEQKQEQQNKPPQQQKNLSEIEKARLQIEQDLNNNQEFLKLAQRRKQFVKSPPEDFICPLTQKVFVDPVITEDGVTYEKIAIETWFLKYDTSPITNLHMSSKFFMENYGIQQVIQDYQE